MQRIDLDPGMSFGHRSHLIKAASRHDEWRVRIGPRGRFEERGYAFHKKGESCSGMLEPALTWSHVVEDESHLY